MKAIMMLLVMAAGSAQAAETFNSFEDLNEMYELSFTSQIILHCRAVDYTNTEEWNTLNEEKRGALKQVAERNGKNYMKVYYMDAGYANGYWDAATSEFGVGKEKFCAMQLKKLQTIGKLRPIYHSK